MGLVRIISEGVMECNRPSIKSREMSGWMSVSDEAGSPLVLFHKAQMDRWKEEVTLVQNKTRWMH